MLDFCFSPLGKKTLNKVEAVPPEAGKREKHVLAHVTEVKENLKKHVKKACPENAKKIIAKKPTRWDQNMLHDTDWVSMRPKGT